MESTIMHTVWRRHAWKILVLLAGIVAPLTVFADDIILGEFRGSGEMQYRTDFASGHNFTDEDCEIAVNLDYEAPYLDYWFSEYCYLGTPSSGSANDTNLRFFVNEQEEIFLVKADGSLSEAPVGMKRGNRFTITLQYRRDVRLRWQPAHLRDRFHDYYRGHCLRREIEVVTLREDRHYDFVLHGDSVELRRRSRREHLPLFISQRCRDRFSAAEYKFRMALDHNAVLQRFAD